MRNLALFTLSIVVIGACSCDSGTSATDAGWIIDSGFPDARRDGGVECNPATNLGCAPNDKCAVIIQSATPFLTTTDCVAAGTVNLGGVCGFDPPVADGGTGGSDCVGGTECNSGVCVRVCDTNSTPSDCVTDEICQQYNGYYPGADFGFCDPTCEPNGDDGAGGQDTGCDLEGTGEGCYPNIFSLGSICGSPFCDADNLCTEGSQCGCINCCNQGKGCVTLNAAEDALQCAKLCITPDAARGLLDTDLPLAPDSAHNGQAPWACSRLNDGAGQPDDSRPYPGFVCIPLGGDDAIRYWGDLTVADGWPYGSVLGVCVDTSVDGDPYQFDPNAGVSGKRAWKPKMGARGLLDALKKHPDFSAIIEHLEPRN